MRLIIAFFLCVLATAGYAQFPASQQTGAPKTIIRNKGGAAADSGTVLSVNFTDTTQANLGFLKGVPNIVIVANDTLWRRNNAATQWVKVGAGGGGSTVDSFFYQLRQLNDTTVLFDRGDGVVDTLAISGSGGGGGGGLDKVDSVTTVGDSLFYWINGDEYFVANLATAAAGGDTTIFVPIIDTTGNDNYRVLYAKDNKITASSYMKWSEVFNRLTISPTSIITSNYDSIRLVVDGAIYTGRLVSISGRFENNGGSGMTASNDSLKFTPTPSATDTSTYKPAALSSTGGLVRMSSWPITPSIDTTSLSNRINLKLNISDTAAMLSPYLKVADTVGTGSLYIRNQFATQENKKFSVIQGKVDALDFNATSSIADSTQRLTWDDGNGTLNIGLKGGQVNLAVGQEQVARVYNDAGVTLNDGDIVYITGAQGNRIKVQKAINTNSAIAHATLGVVTEPIAAGAEGFITIMGGVNKLATDTLAEGVELWLDSVAGRYTDVKPSYPLTAISIGRVERSHATVGSIYVKVAPEPIEIVSYGKNATRDSTILLLSNGQRFAAKDSTGGGGGITIDSVAVRRIPQGTFNHYVGFNSGVGGTGTSGGNVTTDGITAGENFVAFKDAGFSFRTTGRFDGNNFLIGNSSGKWITNQAYNIGIGYQTLGGSNTTIADSLWTSLGTGGAHIALGFQSLSKIKGGDNLTRNIAIGYQALQNYTTCSGCASSNISIGGSSMQATTTGTNNVAIGQGVLNAQTTGGSNTGVGNGALQYGNNSQNTAVGISALGGTSFTGGINTAIGAYAGQSMTSGNYNTLVGQYAGLDLTSGSHNVGIGTGLFNVSARPATTGEKNLAIMGESRAATTGSHNIAIGYGVQSLSLTSSNQFALGGNAIRWLISDVSGSSRRWTFNGTTSDITATEASAALEVRSTTGGLLVPRMTATQASAIGTPANGNILYVTDTNATFTSVGFWGRENGAWVKL